MTRDYFSLMEDVWDNGTTAPINAADFETIRRSQSQGFIYELCSKYVDTHDRAIGSGSANTNTNDNKVRTDAYGSCVVLEEVKQGCLIWGGRLVAVIQNVAQTFGLGSGMEGTMSEIPLVPIIELLEGSDGTFDFDPLLEPVSSRQCMGRYYR